MQPKKILVIGNCLSLSIATVARAYYPDCEVVNLHFEMKDIVEQFRAHAEGSDLVLAQTGLDENIFPPGLDGLVTEFAAQNSHRVLRYPRLVFAGFHPDCVYAWNTADGSGIFSPFTYHSAIAVEAFRRGFSVERTITLYNERVFDVLGYFDYFQPSVRALEEECRRAGLPGDTFPRKWFGLPFMYTINHPRMTVAWDVAEHLLRKAGFAVPAVDRERNQPDIFFFGPIWPIYPEIARKLGVPGGYAFMPSTDYSAGARHEVYDLAAFVAKCFDLYRTLDFSGVALSQPTATKFIQIDSAFFDDVFAASPAGAVASRKTHPYSIVRDHQMWRRAISDMPCSEVDPVLDAPFGIVPKTKIATAGSCFAQHIAKALQRSGYTYFVTELPDQRMTADASQRSSYGVFSARYGNIYTARQLLQLVRRAYGAFEPQDVAWLRDDGRYVDPFRPQIEPDGYASADAVVAARAQHFRAVRRIIEESDVFVFTLGLTEGWERRSDGAVFPLAPGTAGGDYDAGTYQFINFRAAEVVSDMVGAISEMRQRNPALRFILTVSPVPLIATAEINQHVLTATTYSKAVLRVAAEEISRTLGDVAYFPSFEVITGNFNSGAYFAGDLREIRMAGVEHVMRLFFRHFAVSGWDQAHGRVAGGPDDKTRSRIESQILSLYEVVCDEETIGRMAGA